jgi:mannose-1-phosphate guanylyltransferase
VLTGKTILFQEAVNRVQYLKDPSIKLNNLFIVANEEHQFLILD